MRKMKKTLESFSDQSNQYSVMMPISCDSIYPRGSRGAAAIHQRNIRAAAAAPPRPREIRAAKRTW